jgi:hypothetical protein
MPEELSAAAIREIERLTAQGMASTFVKRPGDPDHIVHLVNPRAATCEQQTVEPKPLALDLHSVPAFIEYVKNQKHEDGLLTYSKGCLCFWHDKTTRRDQAFFNFNPSKQWSWLEDSDSKSIIPHADFVRLLRVSLRGCYDPTLLPIVRNMKWKTGSETEANIQHGRESMGRQITQQATGEGNIPEEVTLRIPVFANWEHPENIDCAIELVPQSQGFRLIPFAQELDRAMASTMEALDDILASENLTAFHGEA